MLMGNQQQQPYGYTYPGAGSPPNTQIAPSGGVPTLPTPPSPGANAGANAHPMMQPPPMPAGASGTPQNGSGMFQGLANNPMLMASMAHYMGGGAGVNAPAAPAAPAAAAATQTGNGAMGPYPQTVASPYQMGPFTQAQTGGGQLPGAVNPQVNPQNSWLQQLMARLQGGGGAPQ
jgi:hypothetical protein